MKPDGMTRSLLDTNSQSSGMRSSTQNSRNFYPGIVVNNLDPLQMSRIVCRIINLDQNGNILGGRDRDVQNDSDLVLCMPAAASFLIALPLVGELVWLILENPDDNSSNRLYMGSISSSFLNLRSDLYRTAVKIMDRTPFATQQIVRNNVLASSAFPQPGEVGLLGRQDAGIIFRQKESYLYAGAFDQGSFTINPNVGYLDIKQVYQTGSTLANYSQTNLVSTNVNLYSPQGKFMSQQTAQYEINHNLQFLNQTAQSLEPAVLGASLVRVISLIVRVLLNHIHTPEMPLVKTNDSLQLSNYTVNGLQEILSNFVRIN